MYIIRDIFKAKPGKSKELVGIFKATSPYFLTKGVKNIRIMTDFVAEFWTVIWEFEVDEVQDYFDMSEHIDSDIKVFNALEGYQEHVLKGSREILKIE